MKSVGLLIGGVSLIFFGQVAPARAAGPAIPVTLQGGAFIAYQDASGVMHTQPNFPYHALFTPDDPNFSLQWNFPAIQVPQAWDFDQTPPVNGGDAGILVAVLDTGLAYESYGGYQAAPDIAASTVWTNPNETVDGVDNDGNGYIDDVHGWDFVNNDAHPNDDHGHGTHVAGTIAGATNNAVATAGIAFESRLLPLKVLNATGNGTTATLIGGVTYAIQAGADIINLSLGGNLPDPALEQKITEAVQRGIIVISAAGNDGDNEINYPAHYAGVLAVGAVQYDRQRASYSDYGPELDLVAPGGNTAIDQNSDGQPDGILQQTCVDANCNTFQPAWYGGTSQAAAHVSGAAALLLASGIPPGSVAAALKSTATDLGPAGYDPEYGFGLIQIASAMLIVTPSPATTALLQSGRGYPYASPNFSWAGPSGTVYRVTWGLSNQAGTSTLQTSTTFRPTINQEGSYRLQVRIQDSQGQETNLISFRYRYRRPVIVIGQTSDDPGIRLYTTAPKLIRAWNGGLGAVQTDVSGGALATDGSFRIFVTGQDRGRTIKVKNTHGATIQTLEPFGAKFTGSLDAAVLISANRREVVSTTRTTDDQVVWISAAGKTTRRLDVYRTYAQGLQVATGDLDGDGQDEIVTAMTAGHEVRVYRANGTKVAAFSPAGKKFTGGWNVATGDLDGDGRKEILLVGQPGGGRPRVFVVTMRGTVKKTWLLQTLPYRGPVDIAAADMDGDGVDELIAGYVSSDRLAVWSLGGKKQAEHRLLTNGKGLHIAVLQ